MQKRQAVELTLKCKSMGAECGWTETRGDLKDMLRLGSANIPVLWLSDEEMPEKRLVQG